VSRTPPDLDGKIALVIGVPCGRAFEPFRMPEENRL
jgi:hypothetical protein